MNLTNQIKKGRNVIEIMKRNEMYVKRDNDLDKRSVWFLQKQMHIINQDDFFLALADI